MCMYYYCTEKKKKKKKKKSPGKGIRTKIKIKLLQGALLQRGKRENAGGRGEEREALVLLLDETQSWFLFVYPIPTLITLPSRVPLLARRCWWGKTPVQVLSGVFLGQRGFSGREHPSCRVAYASGPATYIHMYIDAYSYVLHGIHQKYCLLRGRRKRSWRIEKM
jgi:hypothetical protein